MKIIEKKSIVPLPQATGSISDTTNIDDKVTNTYSARIIDELVATGSGSGGTSGTSAFNNLVPIGCAIRPTSNGWILIKDTRHEPINVTGISIEDGKLKLTHTPNAKKVGALTVTPDETFLKQGYFAGASVGVDNSLITIVRNITAGCYIRYYPTGSSSTNPNFPWLVNTDYQNLIEKVEWVDNGDASGLKIHFVNEANVPHSSWNVTTRQNVYKAISSSYDKKAILVQIIDSSGNLVTDKSKYDFISVQYFYDHEVDANLLVTNPIQGANFWISGYAWE